VEIPGPDGAAKRVVVEPGDPRASDPANAPRPDALPFLVLAFPWRITVGTLVTAGVALCFRTPRREG
jgi:hypothetical protein